MITKKNLWFLTLFSLVLVLSIYYITMPNDLLKETENNEILPSAEITELNLIETLKTENEATTMEEINKLKQTISNDTSTTEVKNEAFDALKTIQENSSQESLLINKIKLNYGLDSFIKIEQDQIRVVIDSDKHDSTLANNIMRTIQEQFDTKKYISIQFK